MDTESTISKLADAIAYAEGYYSGGSRPDRNNNPGDLTVDVTGTGIGHDGPFIIYETASDGWDALKSMIRNWFNGSSSIYNTGMNLYQVASNYTATDVQSWVANVATRMGVDPGASLESYITSATNTLGSIVGDPTLMIAGAIIVYFAWKKGKL